MFYSTYKLISSDEAGLEDWKTHLHTSTPPSWIGVMLCMGLAQQIRLDRLGHGV